MHITGVIQAGGKSMRMGGEPKALVELGGRRLIERVVAVVREVVDDVLVVTNTPEVYRFLGLPMVPDVFPDHGSLGGNYSGLAAASGAAAFTVACDMPFLHGGGPSRRRPGGGGRRRDPRACDQLQTLHAVYGKACLPHMEARLHAGRFKIAASSTPCASSKCPRTTSRATPTPRSSS